MELRRCRSFPESITRQPTSEVLGQKIEWSDEIFNGQSVQRADSGRQGKEEMDEWVVLLMWVVWGNARRKERQLCLFASLCNSLHYSFPPAPSFQKVTIRVEYGCSATLQIIGQRRDGMACNDWRVARHNKRLRRRRPATPFSKTTWLALPKLANSSIQNPNPNDGKQLSIANARGIPR
jgi:hypothetical protein